MYQGERLEQDRNNYGQVRYKGRYRSNSRDRYSRPSYRARCQVEKNIKKVSVCSIF